MRQEDPRTSSWTSHMLRLEPGSVTLEAQEPYRTKDFCQTNSAPAENCNLTFPPLEVPNSPLQFR